MSDKQLTYENLKENRTLWPIAELIEWDKNPRFITEENFEVLKKKAMTEQFKPILVMPNEDGTASVLGGNMRLKVMKTPEWQQKHHTDKAWVSVITFTSNGNIWTSFVNGEKDLEFKSKEDGMLHYALSDNEEAGQYNEIKLQEVAFTSGLSLNDYLVDMGDPVKLSTLTEQVAPPEIEQPTEPIEEKQREVTCPECGKTFSI